MQKERGSARNRNVDRYVGIPLSAVTSVVRIIDRKKVDNVSSIGVMCLGALGDLLLVSVLIGGLRRKYPNSRIDLYTTKGNFAASELLSGVDNVYPYPLSKIPSLILQLRKKKYSIFVDTSQWARIGAVISGLSGAMMTVGFQTDGQYRSLPYEIKVPHRNDQHEWKNFLDLGRAISSDIVGVPFIKLPTRENPLPITQQKYVVCHVWATGSNVDGRSWHPSNWGALAGWFVDNGYKVLFSGSPADRDKTDMLIEQLPRQINRDMVENIAGSYSLPDLAEIFKTAAIVVSVNTGPMHLASLVGASTLCLNGPTDPARWGGVGDNCHQISPIGATKRLNLGFEEVDIDTNVDNIVLDDVINTVKEIMG